MIKEEKVEDAVVKLGSALTSEGALEG